jgi:hypothetical protein
MLRNLLLAWIVPAAALAAGPGDQAPLFFIANHGQASSEVRFMAQGSGLTAYFSREQALFRIASSSMRLEFLGAAPSSLEGITPLDARANFLTGTEDEWRRDVPLYGAILYRDLYPGIDMLYGANGRNLKSEFLVTPGADPARIRLRYSGAGQLRIDETGALVIPVNGHELREEAPLVWQDRGGARVTIEARFALAPDGTVSFIVNEYNRSLPLLIDPVLSYSTLLGGSSSDAATALAVDFTGAAYVAGYTASFNFPTGSSAQNFNAGGNDIFVAKLNPAGNSLISCTYIGGRGDDRAYAIAVDASGLVYLTGSTTSTNFPTRGAIQSRLTGAKNAFVLKLNALGNALVFSTYLGGNGSDTGYGIALDAAGDVYVTGDTTSTAFPATALQKSNNGSQDAFLSRLAANGSALVFSTYLGGENDDHGAAIAVSAGGEACITGSTWSPDFPVANASQASLAGGQDAFIARFSAGANSLIFSSFLGGSGGALGYPEAGQGIALDPQGNVYIAGVTSSSDFPLLRATQAFRLGAVDAFAAKLSAAGVLAYSSYLGGTGVDTANAIAVDSAGNAYVAGHTFSSDLPVLNAAQSSSGGDYDAFLGALSPAGDSLLFLTYLGGNGSDTATAVTLDAAGNLYLAGWTMSTNFPLLNAYQSTNSGNYGAFVAKFGQGTLLAAVGVTPSSGSGASQTFAFEFSDSAGADDLTTVSVLFHSTATTVNACAVTYDRAANSLRLLTDDGTVPSGAIAPGSGSQQNSQCVLNGSGSSVNVAGNTLTLNVAIAFQSTFQGSRNIYMQAANASASTGWLQRGTWTVPVSAETPSTVSVTPGLGSGSAQTFSFTYSHPNGHAAIVSAQMLINGSLSPANGCYLLYHWPTKALYLTNDTGTAWQKPVTLGQSGTLQNSQCSVNAAASSASGSGNTLTVDLALTFLAAFSGAKNIYMDVFDGKNDSGWGQHGTWTVPVTGATPSAVSVTPSSGSGTTQTFSLAYSHPNGHAAIVSTQVLVNNPISMSNACYLLYHRATNTIYLANDAGTTWLAPVTLGQSKPLENSQCSVGTVTSSALGNGNVLTLTLSLTFKPGFSGARKLYMEVTDGTNSSGWQERGAWTVSSGGPPSAVSVAPASGSGATQSFSFAASDPDGYAGIVSAQMLVHSSLSTSGGCYLLYYRPTNAIYLTNDTATSWQKPVTLGQAGTLENSQCAVNPATSSATGNGTTLTISLSLTFKSAFKGTKNVYMEVYDGSGDSGWQQRGTWTIP